MESEKVVDVWSQEAYQSSYRTSYCNHEQNFADHVDRVQSSNAVRLLLKSAGLDVKTLVKVSVLFCWDECMQKVSDDLENILRKFETIYNYRWEA